MKKPTLFYVYDPIAAGAGVIRVLGRNCNRL